MTRFSIQGVFFVILLLLTRAGGQETAPTVTVRVDASHAQGAFRPIWNFFGYDEPNYTYAPNGKKLLGEIPDPPALAEKLCHIPGVIEHGLFIGMAELAFIGKDGKVVQLRR